MDNPEIGQQALNLVKELITSETLTDRPIQFWDQLNYDSYFRGTQDRGQIDNIDGRLQFVDHDLDASDRYTDSDATQAPGYNFNLFKRGVRMHTALFGVRPPAVRMVPVNPRNPDHVRAARVANRINRSYETVLDPESLQTYLAFLTGKSGPVFGYTRWVSSKKFGSRMVPNLVEETFELAAPAYTCPMCQASGFADDLADGVCPGCGSYLAPENFDEGLSETMLMPTGEAHEVLNGSVVCSLHTLASVTVPAGYRKLDDCPWLFLVEERDAGELSQVYDIPVGEISAFGGIEHDQLTGKQVRSAIGGYTGRSTVEQSRVKATVGTYWLSPSQYSRIQDEGVRAVIAGQFPEGCKLTVVAGKPVRIEPEALTDVWKVCMPEEGDTLLTQPYLADSVGLTDVYNTAMQLNVEAVAHSVPLHVYDPDIVSREDLLRHGRQHASFIASKQRGRDLNSAMSSFRPAEFRPETNVLAETIFAKHDELQGYLPIIWGSVAGAETAYETSSAKNQALAMLAIPWVMQRKFHEGQRRQALLQIAKFSDGVIHLSTSDHPSPSNAVQVASVDELELVLGGGWRPVSDEQMPISAGQIKDIMRDLLSGNFPPEVQEALGLLAPANIPLINSYLGIPGMRSPLLEEVESVTAFRDDLLMEEPVPDEAMGAAPSQPIDPFLHRPQLVLEIFRPWLLSEEGRLERETNPGGWMNVRLVAMQAEQVLQQQAMEAQMQAQDPGGPGGPGGPGPGVAMESGAPGAEVGAGAAGPPMF